MSRYFAPDPDTGEYQTIAFRRHPAGHQVMYLGKRVVGEVWHNRSGWTVVSHAQPPHLRGLRKVDGFRTRIDAMVYLLEVGVYKPDPFLEESKRLVEEMIQNPIGE